MLNADVVEATLPVPSFGWNGLIPPFTGNGPARGVQSPYWVSMVDMAAALGTSNWRRGLLQNLLTYRGILYAEGYQAGFQFVDGSFVENVEALQGREPGDIDVLSFLEKPPKYIGNSHAWLSAGMDFWNLEIADWQRNKTRFHLDTYATLIEDALVEDIMYWHGLFSHQRATYNWKGYLRVALDPADDAAALTVLGGPQCRPQD